MERMMKQLMAGLAMAGLVLSVPAARAADEEAAPEAPEGKVELKLELPRPMFHGTPTDLASANLEEPLKGGVRAPIFVADGAELLSEGKPVSSSDEAPIVGDLELITDGDKDGADGSYVELGPMTQWVQIDLEEAYAIDAVVIWHYHSQARVYRDVIVKVSDDPDFIEAVTTVFSNDHDNSAGQGIGKDKEYIETYQGRPIPVDGVKGRYVRLYSAGNTSNDQNHYVEVEVYGRSAQ